VKPRDANHLVRVCIAYGCLRTALMQGRALDDDELDILMRCEADLSERKAIVSGLLGFGMVSRDQAGMPVYLSPEMKDA
jgi:hypothetical protein